MVLATEYTWAERALERTCVHAAGATNRLHTTRTARVGVALSATALITGGAAAVILDGYPAACRPLAWAAALGPLTLWAAAPLFPLERDKQPVALEGAGMFDGLDNIDGFEICGTRVGATIESSTTAYRSLPN